MNRDLIILLKSIYKNTNDREHHIFKLDEMVAAFNLNILEGEQMMVDEKRLLENKVS